MPDFTDFLEALLTGRWKYLSGLVAGTVILILIRLFRYSWKKKQDARDADFVERNLTVPIERLKKKVSLILLSLASLLIVVLPGSLWVTVELLKKNASLPDAQKALITFALVILLTIVVAVQGVRLRRLRRRIKLIEKRKSLAEQTAGTNESNDTSNK